MLFHFLPLGLTDVLQKLGQGLDIVHPFSYTEIVAKLIRDANKIFTADSSSVSGKNAVRIWAFIARFVVLDRFAKTLGVAQLHPGTTMPKTVSFGDDFGGATKVRIEMKYPNLVAKPCSAPGRTQSANQDSRQVSENMAREGCLPNEIFSGSHRFCIQRGSGGRTSGRLETFDKTGWHMQAEEASQH
jgi:hypothetical protein